MFSNDFSWAMSYTVNIYYYFNVLELEVKTNLQYPDLGVLVHANRLQQVFASVVDGLDEGLALGVDEALELHAGFLF